MKSIFRRTVLAAALVPAIAAPAVAQVSVTVSSAPSPASVEASSPLVIGETFTIASRVLGEERRINVYVPPRWGPDANDPLPVLYMPDGGIREDFLHVAGLLQVSVGNGTMRPFLLVGIENTERRRDMTGPTRNANDRKIAPRVGGSAAFRQFIRTELIPEVEARYRTTRERAIVGESLAGLFVVETFLVEPRLFDTYIAFDPSLWWDDNRLVATARERLAASAQARSEPAELLLANSSEAGIATLVQQFADALRKDAPATLRWHHVPMPEESHATIYHPAALRAFRLLFAPAPAD